MSLLDLHEIEITCPNCRAQIKRPLRWFKQHGNACRCGAGFETDELRRVLEQAERSLADTLRRLGNFRL
ncbi:hypothetical protein ACW73L_07345 [Methylolobus aquaticus]